MPEIQFDYNKLVDNPNTQVYIALPNFVTVLAALTSEISIGGSNEYVTPFEAGSLQQKLAGGANIGITAINTAISNLNLPTLGGKHVLQTIKTWSGSSPLKLNLNIALIATKNSDDVRIGASELIQTCYPSVPKIKFENGEVLEKVAEEGSKLLVAPMGYSLNSTGGANNTVVIQIGKWLRVPDLLITEANFTFSSAVLPSGNPLYATGNVSFEPFKQVTGDEVAGYLKGITG